MKMKLGEEGGEDVLVDCWRYVDLREGDVVCKFGEGVDVGDLAEEFGTASGVV